jgi:aryl-alcohol dehydrogenase-like predicted oxidoreductase
LAEREEIGIVARCPLDEGALTGKITPETTFPEDDWRCGYFCDDRLDEVHQRAKDLEWLVHGDVESLCEAALRFCLSYPVISATIVGMRRLEHVEANVKASSKGPLPPEDLERLKEHVWSKNFWV